MQILYGIGMLKAEEFIRKNIGDGFTEIGAVSHRLAILDVMEKSFTTSSEAVLVLNEGLPDKNEILLLDLISQIRMQYPKVRIVLLAGNHEAGDSMLAALVGMGVYDIAFGAKFKMDDAIRLILHPNTYADAVKFVKPANFTSVQEVESPVLVAQVEEPTQTEEERIYPKKLKNPVVSTSEPEDIPLEDIAPPIVVQANKLPTSKKKPDKQPEKKGDIGKTKVVSFFSCCAGMGNREIALSVSCGLAMKGEKVVLIDCTDDIPLYLSRLDFSNETDGIYGAIRESEGGSIRQSLYSPAVDVKNADFKRLSKIPNSLFFMTFTFNDNQHKVSVEDLGRVVQVLCKEGVYDSVVICCSRMWDVALMKTIIEMSSIAYMVSTQSSYSFRIIEDIAKYLPMNRVRVLFNKYEKGIQPSINTAKEILGVEGVDFVPCDNKGFLAADSCALPYILVKTTGRVSKALSRLVLTIQKKG